MRKHSLVIPVIATSTIFLAPPAFADNWIPVTGADTLTDLVSGATAIIELRSDVTATGRYLPGGTGTIEAWGATFDRTWRVEGEDRVCYASNTETNCYTFEQNQAEPNEYRVHHVSTGESYRFRLEEGEETLAVGSGSDEGGLGSPSAAEIAEQLSNPNTSLGTMALNLDYIRFDGDLPGAGSQSATRMLFQPSLPYPLSESTNVFARPAIPLIIDQDVPVGSVAYDNRSFELGDIGFDLALGKSLPGGLVVIGGVVGTLPTATDDALGLDQWLLGPEIAVALTRPWGVAGVLLTHQWDIAGEDAYDTSITGGQYFYAFNLGGGWQINGSPTFSYNHEARNSENKLSFPLAIGVSRTVILSGRPWKFGLQYWHYIESPDDFGPDYQVRFSVAPVVELPW